MRPRVWIGRDVRVVSESPEVIELEGRMRLRPGRDVDVARTGADPSAARSATVFTWRIVRVGTDGPVFRGLCRWL
jgi:hypothetical protein